MYIKRYLAGLVATVCCVCSWGQTQVRFHDEAADTVRINALLKAVADARLATPEERVAFVGRELLGTPYVAHTLEGEPEMLTVNLDEIDCTTFVETALAMAFTVGERRTSWRDFVYNLQRLRYRGGEVDGYPSRLHYIADWAVDNIHRGNLVDATRLFTRYNDMTRSIDFMTAHRDRYPALADSANYARMRAVEDGYRNHRFPYIKSADLGLKGVKSQFRNGDVVAFVSNLKDLDVTHMGIVVRESPTAEPHVLHASSSEGRVVISKLPLAEFMKKNRQWVGVRVFRLADN